MKNLSFTQPQFVPNLMTFFLWKRKEVLKKVFFGQIDLDPTGFHWTSISLLIIPCMIVYVTNKREPWTLNLIVHIKTGLQYISQVPQKKVHSFKRKTRQPSTVTLCQSQHGISEHWGHQSTKRLYRLNNYNKLQQVSFTHILRIRQHRKSFLSKHHSTVILVNFNWTLTYLRVSMLGKFPVTKCQSRPVLSPCLHSGLGWFLPWQKNRIPLLSALDIDTPQN